MVSPLITWNSVLNVEVDINTGITYSLKETSIDFYVHSSSNDTQKLTANFYNVKNDLGKGLFSKIILLEDSFPKEFQFNFSWLTLSDESLSDESLIALYDAVYINDKRKVPGFINISRGSSPIAPFLRKIKIKLNSAIVDPMKKYDLKIAKTALEKGAITRQKLSITKFEDHIQNSGEQNNSKCIEITVKCKNEIYRNVYIESCCALPVPPYNGLDKLNRYIVVGNESKSKYIETLEKICSTARSEDKIIMVTGRPGAGKDVASVLISRLSLINFNKYQAISVAGYSAEQLKNLLFGKIVEGEYFPGKIEEAENGLIFLDEFDKVGEGRTDFYNSLLRVLESKEYIPENGKLPYKCRNVSWIFAGAFNEGKKDIPPDFYSRLSANITIENALYDNESNLNESYFRLLFCYFYLTAVCNELDVAVEDITDKNNKVYASLLARSLLGIKLENESEPIIIFPEYINTNRVFHYADKLFELVKEKSHYEKKPLTIRPIKKAAEAMVSEAKDFFIKQSMLQDIGNNDTERIFKKGKEIIEENLKKQDETKGLLWKWLDTF